MADAATITAIASLGGLTKAALYDGRDGTAKARATYDAHWVNGHDCAVCPRVEIPADLPDEERQRRGAKLRQIHFKRLGMRRRRLSKAA